MGRKLTDTDFSPTAQLKRGGAMLLGVLKGKRTITTTFGSMTVYQFAVEDANCEFVKDKQPVDVNIGDVVDVFGTKKLTRQLDKAEVGERIKIEYAGLGKKSLRGGNAPHLFTVEVL